MIIKNKYAVIHSKEHIIDFVVSFLNEYCPNYAITNFVNDHSS